MIHPEHIGNGLLIRFLDHELSSDEAVIVKTHLARCAECRLKLQEFQELSNAIQLHVESVPQPQPELVIRRFGWSMAIAAGFVMAVMFLPRTAKTPQDDSPLSRQNVFEVADEAFVALPYSNADLPLSSPQIVQMHVPLAALANAGVEEPMPLSSSVGDESVLADVLLGSDGEPMGIHVLNND